LQETGPLSSLSSLLGGGAARSPIGQLVYLIGQAAFWARERGWPGLVKREHTESANSYQHALAGAGSRDASFDRRPPAFRSATCGHLGAAPTADSPPPPAAFRFCAAATTT
jgi:hypothetical protein